MLPLLITVLLTTACVWSALCLQTHKYMRKTRYIYTVEYSSARKKKERNVVICITMNETGDFVLKPGTKR